MHQPFSGGEGHLRINREDVIGGFECWPPEHCVLSVSLYLLSAPIKIPPSQSDNVEHPTAKSKGGRTFDVGNIICDFGEYSPAVTVSKLFPLVKIKLRTWKNPTAWTSGCQGRNSHLHEATVTIHTPLKHPRPAFIAPVWIIRSSGAAQTAQVYQPPSTRPPRPPSPPPILCWSFDLSFTCACTRSGHQTFYLLARISSM